VRHIPRPTVDHFTLQKKTTVFEAGEFGEFKVCESCATSAPKSVVYQSLCKKCLQTLPVNCYLLKRESKSYLIDITNPRQIPSYFIEESDRPI